MAESTTKRLEVYAPDGFKERVEAAALAAGMSTSGWLRFSLEDALRASEARRK